MMMMMLMLLMMMMIIIIISFVPNLDSHNKSYFVNLFFTLNSSQNGLNPIMQVFRFFEGV